MAEKYGKLIRKYRLIANMSQHELAQKLGVSDACISSWEVGRTEPDMGTVIEMSVIFDITVSELIGESPNPNITYSLKMDEQEARLVRMYRALPDDRKKELLEKALDLLLK